MLTLFRANFGCSGHCFLRHGLDSLGWFDYRLCDPFFAKEVLAGWLSDDLGLYFGLFVNLPLLF